jgi:hypothetical protein
MDDIVSKEVNIMEMKQYRLDIANETLCSDCSNVLSREEITSQTILMGNYESNYTNKDKNTTVSESSQELSTALKVYHQNIRGLKNKCNEFYCHSRIFLTLYVCQNII